MKKTSICLLSLLLFAGTVALAEIAALTLSIEEPADGASVPEKTSVSGSVNDPQAEVFVVVHPAATGDYWVQQPATVDNDGKWTASPVQFGEGRKGVGEVFEVRAFAGPDTPLQRGQVLKNWPKAAARSNVVRVTRK